MHIKSSAKEIPKPAMSGCTSAAKALQKTNRTYRPRQAFNVANSKANRTIERGVTYWSKMYSEVPATGRVNRPANRHTPDHRASGSSKNSPLHSQQARSVRNSDATYQRNRIVSNDKCDIRTVAAMRFPNCVIRA